MLHKKSISLCGNNSEIEKNLFQISNSEQKELTEDTEVFSEENEVSSAVLVNSIQLDVEEFPQIKIEISDTCKKPKKALFEDFNEKYELIKKQIEAKKTQEEILVKNVMDKYPNQVDKKTYERSKLCINK